MAYKILLTEQSSELAKELISDFETLTFSLSTPDIKSQLASVDGLRAVLDKYQPTVIINTLSLAEPELDLGLLADVCAARDVTLIHLSAADVFSPNSDSRAFLERDKPDGTSQQALAQIAAEQAVAAIARHIILRLPRLLSAASGNWLDIICRALVQPGVVVVSETQRFDPSNIHEVSRVIIALVQQILCGAENWGVLHIHTVDACFEAEVGDHIARILKKEQCLSATLDVIKGPSLWMADAGLLAGNLATNQFGIQMRSWRHGLKHQVMLWLEQYRAEDVAEKNEI